MLACALGIVASIVFPSDPHAGRAAMANPELARVTDDYLRFGGTLAQFALPVVLRDPVGLVQAGYVGLATLATTHGMKWLLDRRRFRGIELGHRPQGGPLSRHNFPSGHASMAASATYFVMRRYGWAHAIYVVPLLLLTLYARVALDAHTTSAVLAAAFVGLLTAAAFTSARRRPEQRS